jgi:hypothetical protein
MQADQQADQIAELYSLLSYEDRTDGMAKTDAGLRKASKSVGDVLKMVKDSLGEEGLRRLHEDGVGVTRRRR